MSSRVGKEGICESLPSFCLESKRLEELRFRSTFRMVERQKVLCDFTALNLCNLYVGQPHWRGKSQNRQ